MQREAMNLEMEGELEKSAEMYERALSIRKYV